MSAQAALPPFFLHLERNAFRGLPCRPLAVAWSEHAFEIACFAGSAGFAAGADCPATGFAAGAVCAIVALEPNTTRMRTFLPRPGGCRRPRSSAPAAPPAAGAPGAVTGRRGVVGVVPRGRVADSNAERRPEPLFVSGPW
jgi:hypothetical protein